MNVCRKVLHNLKKVLHGIVARNDREPNKTVFRALNCWIHRQKKKNLSQLPKKVMKRHAVGHALKVRAKIPSFVFVVKAGRALNFEGRL